MEDDVNAGDNAEMLENEKWRSLENQFDKLKDRVISINVSNKALKLQKQQLRQLNEQRFVLSQQKKFKEKVITASLQQRNKKANKLNNSNAIKRKKSECMSSADSLSDLNKSIRPPSRTNQFALLSVIEITNIDRQVDLSVSAASDSAGTDKQKSSNVNSTENSAGVATQANSTISASSRFCPPIILYNVDIRGLVMQFKNNYPNVEIKIVNNSKYKSKLYIKGIKAYSAMMRVLKEKKISSNSFTPPENKQVSLIVRGLHHRTLPDEIKEDLESSIPGVVANVQIFATPYMKKNNLVSGLFLVSLLTGRSFKDAISVKYVLYQKISWEQPHLSSKEVQCKHCQRWGHIAKNCNHAFQCVKCDKVHEPGKCALLKEENSQAFCVNCKSWGHPANFRGCEAYKLLLAKKISNKRNDAKLKSTTPIR